MKVTVDVMNAQTMEETRGSDMVAVVQDEFAESMDCKFRRNSDTGAHGCESRIVFSRHPKHFGLVDDVGKAITLSEWATLAQDRAGWLKIVTKVPFDIGKPQLRPPRCDTRVTPEETRRF